MRTRKQIQQIEKRLWLLENPPDFKYGDNAYAVISECGTYNETKVRVLSAEVREYKSQHCKNYWWEYLVDTGNDVCKINISQLFKNKQT